MLSANQVFGMGGDCTMDGLDFSCAGIAHFRDIGVAALCPNNDCRMRWDPTAGWKPGLRTGDDGNWQMWHPGFFGIYTGQVTPDGHPIMITWAGWWYDVTPVHDAFPGSQMDPLTIAMAHAPRRSEAEQRKFLGLPEPERFWTLTVGEAAARARQNENTRAFQEWTCEQSRLRRKIGDLEADSGFFIGLGNEEIGVAMGYQGLYEKYINGDFASALAGCSE